MFAFSANSQQKINSGVIYYKVKFKDENIKEIEKRKAQNEEKPSDEFLLQTYKNHKQIYDSGKHFRKVVFTDNSYISTPIKIMLPDYLSGKFILQDKNIYYKKNTENNTLLNFERYNKSYLVPISNSYNWEITTKSKNILGYKSYKANLINSNNESSNISVWFTKGLPISLSPSKYTGLPGAILSYENGLTIMYADKIEFKNVKIKPPEGKVITLKEYQTMFGKPKI